VVDSYGNFPAHLIEVGTKLMRPVENFVSAYTMACL